VTIADLSGVEGIAASTPKTLATMAGSTAALGAP
jgi:hypothetical protein